MAEPKIAVITPYYQEPLAMLRHCHESVRGQGDNVTHFMIADGHAKPEIDEWQACHVRLPSSHGDNGNTPRGVGSLLAQNEGFDYIAYLDADNWYHEGHIASLVDHIRSTKAHVATSFRTFHGVDDAELAVTERAEERLKHVDTSCLFLSKEAFPVTTIWALMPKALSPMCDRVFLGALKHGRYVISSTRQKTVAFRTQYIYHYEMAGVPVPDNAKTGNEFEPALKYLKSNQGIAETVRLLGFWPLHYF